MEGPRTESGAYYDDASSPGLGGERKSGAVYDSTTQEPQELPAEIMERMPLAPQELAGDRREVNELA